MSDGTPWVLAIDLGTSYSLAASQRLGGAAEVLEIGGLRRVPSIVYADDGGPVVGRVALELASSAPARAIRTPKRRLGDPTPAILGGRPHDVTDLVAALLRHIHGEAVRHHGSAPALVRLTHPARWGTARRRGLVAAAERAGLGRVELVAEPVAAAVAYAREARVPVGARVLVYDLGGGTFDTAVLQASADGFDVLGEPGGDETIGGELFDELLVAEVAERALEPDVREQLLTSDDDLWRRAAVLLQSEVCRVKELLSEHPSTDCLVSLPVGMVSERITRDDLRTIVEPYLAETMEVVRDTLAMAGVDVADLAAVHLAGGASRMPLVAELVAETLPGVPLSRRGDPKAAVALGAVLLGAPADRPLGADRVAGGGGSEDDEETVIAAAAAPEAGPVARTAAAAADAATEPPDRAPGGAAGAPGSGEPHPIPTPHPAGSSLRAARRWRRRAPVLAGTAAVVAAGALLVWSPWTDGSSGLAAGTDAPTTESSDPGPTDGGTASETTTTTDDPDGASVETALSKSATTTSEPVGAAAPLGPAELVGHTDIVEDVAWSPDGSELASAGFDATVRLWSPADSDVATVLSGHTHGVHTVAWSPDGTVVASGGGSGSIRLWDAATGAPLDTTISGHDSVVRAIAWSPDGTMLASAGSDAMVRWWDAATGEAIGEPVVAGDYAVWSLAWSPDGSEVAAGGDDGLIRRFVPVTGEEIGTFDGHLDPVSALAWSPSGAALASTSYDAVLVHDPTTGQAALPPVIAHNADVIDLTWSPSGKWLVTVDYDGEVWVWDSADGDPIAEEPFVVHDEPLHGVDWSPDGLTLAAAGADGTLQLWPAPS